MFKTGDKVVCVEADAAMYIKQGIMYTVASTFENVYGSFVQLAEVIPYLGDHSYRMSRFRKCDESLNEALSAFD